MPPGKRARSGPTAVMTLDDLGGSASSARSGSPDEPVINPPRRKSLRQMTDDEGRASGTMDSAAAGKQKEPIPGAKGGGAEKPAPRKKKKTKKTEMYKAMRKVVKKAKKKVTRGAQYEAASARTKEREADPERQRIKRAPGKRREASLAFQQQREEKVEEIGRAHV